ncbi:hypothetical protein HYFRA_00008477 [Hymenoscyphus fraxineus]|uniref:BTB domain-containing protein n=1 Tax=Hymenoscyphus fraxineus TaxID=746836 RepID=A0A9N9PFD4_9HELO|nr:hypothetical protein HYFRA_00008477 [Hymenoscyphus fraxineus]
MSDTKTSSPNFNLGEQSTVTIKVSSKAKTQTFVVHKSFICYYSPFFTAAFNGSFKEGETQHLDLEDIHPSAFAAFIHWLYTQRILWQSGDQGHGATMGDIIELWALGDRFLIPRLSNEALKILSRQDWFLYPQNTSAFLWRRIYETTTKGSKLRQFMIRIGSEVLFDRAYAKDAVALEQYPHEMLADAIVWRRDYHAPAGINFGGLDWPVDDETLREYYLDENEVFLLLAKSFKTHNALTRAVFRQNLASESMARRSSLLTSGKPN